MIEFRLPSLGADMDEGTLLEWRVNVGDPVKRGQIVCVVDTAKAAIDVECWQEGIVHALLIEPGTRIPVGTLMAALRAPDESAEAAERALAALKAKEVAPKPPAAPPARVEPHLVATAPVPTRLRASPAARKRAEELLDRKDLDTINRELLDLTQRTRAGSLRLAELTDATVTVTSLGDRGVAAVFGVIYPPQVAIVGFGRVADRPWVVDGEVRALPVISASLGADHRVSDGHRGGLFLAAVRDLLQAPEELTKENA